MSESRYLPALDGLRACAVLAVIGYHADLLRFGGGLRGVVGLAYNSLFEKDRKNYERGSGIWARNAERVVHDLTACAAKKIIWLALREPAPELVTDAGRDQFQRRAWFFPYVNERIRALAQRHPELGVADWHVLGVPLPGHATP